MSNQNIEQVIKEKPKKRQRPNQKIRQQQRDNGVSKPIQALTAEVRKLKEMMFKDSEGKSFTPSFKQVIDKAGTNEMFSNQISKMDRQFTTNQIQAAAAQKALAMVVAAIDKQFPDMHKKGKKFLLTCFLIDDWSTAFSYAWPYIQQYGPALIKWFVEKWHSYKQDSSPGPADDMLALPSKDFQPSDMAQSPFKPSLFRQQAYDAPGIHKTQYSSLQYKYTHVNKGFIKCVLDPGRFNRRRSRQQVNATALGVFKITQPLTINSDGTVAYQLNHQQLFSTVTGNVTTTASQALLWVTNSTYNVNTGVFANAVAVPSNLIASNVTTFCVNAVRIEFYPSANQFNNQGTHEVIYYQGPPNQSVGLPTTAPAIPEATMSLQPNYQIANLSAALGANRTFTDPADDDFVAPTTTGGLFPDGSSSSAEGFFGVITGGNPGTVAGKLRITITFEYIPITSQIPMSVMDYPEPGIATQPAFTNLIIRCPQILTLPPKQVEHIANAVEEAPCDIDEFCEYISKQIEDLPDRDVVIPSGGNGQILESFDALIE